MHSLRRFAADSRLRPASIMRSLNPGIVTDLSAVFVDGRPFTVLCVEQIAADHG